jgi:hypothetical protein
MNKLVTFIFFLENKSDEQVKTYDKCSHLLSNPLVKRGLIPASLSDVLMPPPLKPAEAKRKKGVGRGSFDKWRRHAKTAKG